DSSRCLGTGIYEMLAIIENDEHLLLAQVIAKHVNDGTLWIISKTKGTRCGVRYKQGIENGSEFDQPYSIGELIKHITSNLNGESRLACPAGTDEREHAVVLQKTSSLCQFFFTPHETCKLHREVVGEHVNGAQRWKILLQIGSDHLKHSHSLGAIF